MEIKKDIQLKDYCTFAIGGPASEFIVLREKSDIPEIVKHAKSVDKELFVFGGGSNLLFPDEGIDKVVVKMQLSGISHQGNILSAEAGVTWVRLMMYLKKNAIYGLEAFSGLPGTIGGATYGNAGCHGLEMKDVIESVEVYDTEAEEFKEIPANVLQFSYRHSSFKQANNYIIVSVKLRISFNPAENTGDPDEFAQFRKENQPQGLTTGSFFKNPENNYAGRLIEECGLKGYRIGGISLSEKHANFFINDGTGTSQEVLQLKDKVIKEVKAKKGIELTPEVQIIK